MNEGHKINNELNFRIIKDDTKMRFRDYDTDWRRQDSDEQMSINVLNNRLSKQIISKHGVNSLDFLLSCQQGYH